MAGRLGAVAAGGHIAPAPATGSGFVVEDPAAGVVGTDPHPIGAAGANLAPEHSNEIIYGYAVGLDMTRRDLQIDMREKKRPWDLGKSFAEAAPIGPVHPVTEVGHPNRGRIALDVNGETRQQGDLAAMIWDVPHILHFLSQYYELLPGDLVFTGTPAGVGPVIPGDLLVGRIEGLGLLSVRIAPPR